MNPKEKPIQLNPPQQQQIPYRLELGQFTPGIIRPRFLAATSVVAAGDLYYSNGTIFIRLPIGTTGQKLTVSANGVPYWA